MTVPSHNLDAELSVLGAMLLSRGAVEVASRSLTGGDFYQPAHRHVFDAVLTLYGAGEPADPVTVAAELERCGVLGEVGGRPALFRLQSEVPAVANVAHYVGLVADCATRRRLLAAGGQIAELASQDDVGEAVRQAEGLLADVGAPASAPDETLTIDQVIEREVELEWVVPGLFARSDRLVLVGTAGSGKSTVLRQSAVLLSQGMFPFPGGSDDWRTAPVRVLHVDCENPAFSSTTEYRKLVAKVKTVQGVEFDPERLRVWERTDGLDLTRRSDVSRLASQIEHARPDVVCAGPIYNMVAADLEEATAVAQFVHVLNGMRKRHGFVLILEGHVPHEGARPFGSSVWTWWPEFGRAMVQDRDDPDVYRLQRFRGDRHATSLPDELRRGGEWPWTAKRRRG